MCEVSSWRLEPQLLPPHSPNTYIYRVTITLKVYGGQRLLRNVFHTKRKPNSLANWPLSINQFMSIGVTVTIPKQSCTHVYKHLYL